MGQPAAKMGDKVVAVDITHLSHSSAARPAGANAVAVAVQRHHRGRT